MAPPSDVVSVAGIPENELTPRVRDALTSLIAEVQSLREELTNARAEMTELRALAETDPLLDVPNRRAFVRELDRSLALNERHNTPASLIFIDLDDLKVLNDTHGHAAGDAGLKHIARILSDNIRQTDILGRLGGDEFGLILNQTDYAIATQKAEALRAIISEKKMKLDNHEIALKISFGVVPLQNSTSADDALKAADAEMYVDKRRDK